MPRKPWTRTQTLIEEGKVLNLVQKVICRSIICFSVTATLLLTSALFGQTTTAQITGRVVDTSGAVVPGATITVKNIDTGGQWHAASNSQGLYVIPELSPGQYKISAKKQGFTVALRSGITLVVDQVAQVNFTLRIGSVTQTVQVKASAPLLSTSTPTAGEVVGNSQIQSLPLNGRSPFRLVLLTPGIHSVPSTNGQFGDIPVNVNDDSLISIDGGPAAANVIMIDGIPANTGNINEMTTIPSVDATQEFDVLSGPLKAEWGRSGGGVINVYTKSGTNRVHGDLYEFLRNNAFDANDFFDNRAGRPKIPFRMNQFGFTLGGPVYIPKVYNGQNKTFFFVDYQGTRWRQGQTYISTLPTPAERNGDFSQTFDSKGQLIQIYNPFSTQPDPSNPSQFIRSTFSGNQIPSTLIDPVAEKALTYVPLPNLPGNPTTHTNNFISNANRAINEAELGIKIDENINAREKMFERLSFNRNTLGQPNTFGNVATPCPAGCLGKLHLYDYSAGVNSTTTLNPSSVLSISYGFARFYWGRPTHSFGFDQSQLGFPSSLVNQEAFPLFPNFTIAGFSKIGGGGAMLFMGYDTHSLLASLTKISGRHTLKFGVDVRLMRDNTVRADNAEGEYSFNRNMTAGPNPNNFATNAGSGLASFLLGTAASGSMGIPVGSSLQSFYYAGYAQDDFHITPKLTLSYGLRYSATSPMSERRNELNWFNFNAPSPAENSQFPDLTGALQFASSSSRTVYNWMTDNFQPRFGFAYNPFTHTVVRGGIGLMYLPLNLNAGAILTPPDAGYSSSTPMIASLNGVTPFNLLSDPFPTGLTQPVGSSLGAATFLGQGVSVWERSPILPSVWQWNFDIQQELKGFLFDLSYAGSKGTHLVQPREFDALPTQDYALGSGLQQLVPNPFYGIIQAGALSRPMVTTRQLLLPYPQFTSINVQNSTYGNSIYNAMELKVKKPLRHGMTFLASYTVSKWIANVLSSLTTYNNSINAGLNTSVQNPNDLQAERSTSELDTPQVLSINYVAKLPFGAGQRFFPGAHGFVNRLIGGWQSNGIINYRSGYPLVMSAPIVGGGNRPNRTCSGVISGSRSHAQQIQEWFNTSCFSVPPAFTFGNDSRTEPDLRGPSFTQIDFALEKNDHLFGDKANLMFRAEAFNLFNTPHFWLPNTNAGSLTRGQIQSTTGTPRVIQFALKLSF